MLTPTAARRLESIWAAAASLRPLWAAQIGE
jgi:hypothetical protein